MQNSAIKSLRLRLVPPVTRPLDARGWSLLVMAVSFGIALPLFIILANVEFVTRSDWAYSYNWWRNGIPERTGLPLSELNSGADQIKDYFANDEELLDLRVNYQGEVVSLYREREVLHMVDVKDLMQGVFLLARVLAGVMVVLAVAGIVYLRREFWDLLLLTLRWSALGSGIVVGVLGIAMLIDFNFVFTQFHFLSFANDLWLLNPNTDFLIIMFPQRFFFEATMFIAVMSVAQFALFVYAVRLVRKRAKSAGSAGGQSIVSEGIHGTR